MLFIKNFMIFSFSFLYCSSAFRDIYKISSIQSPLTLKSQNLHRTTRFSSKRLIKYLFFSKIYLISHKYWYSTRCCLLSNSIKNDMITDAKLSNLNEFKIQVKNFLAVKNPVVQSLILLLFYFTFNRSVSHFESSITNSILPFNLPIPIEILFSGTIFLFRILGHIIKHKKLKEIITTVMNSITTSPLPLPWRRPQQSPFLTLLFLLFIFSFYSIADKIIPYLSIALDIMVKL